MKTHKVLFQGPCNNGLYTLPAESSTEANKALMADLTKAESWHRKLGHPNKHTFDLISKCNPNLNLGKSFTHCATCAMSKCHKMSFELSKQHSTTTLALIHSDVWGPVPTISNQGFKYYVIFVDDFSRFTWLFPLRMKSEVFQTFINFKNQVETYTNKKIKVLRTDGGTEYMNHAFSNFLCSNGITHQVSCPYTPEQNGIAERKHRHITETTRTLLHTSSTPFQFWPDAALTANYLINRLPSPTLHNLSPFEKFHNAKPNYTFLRTFGCACYPLIPSQFRHKLQPKASPHVFLGYSDMYKGYKCLDTTTNKIIFSRHVSFHESSFPFSVQTTSQPDKPEDIPPLLLAPASTTRQPKPTLSTQFCPPISNTSNVTNSPVQNMDLGNLSQPPSTLIMPSHPMTTRSKTGSLRPSVRMNLLHKQTSPIHPTAPTSYTEAIQHAEWREAMAMEFFALQQQGTWSLTTPPPDALILGCKWTFRLKLHADGSIAKHKARLVAQGNHQEYGIDYTETFSPVAKLPTIRVLLTVALHNNWPVQQLDVANAFLHGNLSETVYMTQPKGFEDTSHPNQVCRLHKSIYGLKQSPRQWYNTFTEFLGTLGFIHSQSDPSLLL
ncbi:Retrovirus-related Pol polyprotein from transposon TNT 1-94 [Dendrobium catenatum]|uniref:Retrovirus-related Pol polyprotein from transposon TNT 1-94 n=1 Tax=Dendrobium catenatum TaxID=906689 RepID=A0A2I0X1B7_9ASPA|nr:Retrovirus-related Pol polyprotein from transposon TNT 1-94 [Dendrobium catenatum]